MIDPDKLRALDEKATQGPWEAKVWRHSHQSDTVCIKADGREIIGWNGFDGVACTKAQIRANAKLTAHLRNAVPAILAMAEENRRMREALSGLYAAFNARAVRGRDHVPSMRDEQKATMEALKILRDLGGGKDVMSGLTFDGKPIPERPAPHIVCFCIWMAARVVQKRGGKNSQYLRECADFMTDVVGKRLSIKDPLPSDYDWNPSTAIECADAMMEYDT